MQFHPVIESTRRWIESAVIGLDLCPFAKRVYSGEKIRYRVTEVATDNALLDELAEELNALAKGTNDGIETTLLIHPQLLTDFLDYNDFLDIADRLIERMDLSGTIQLAGFHPKYQFAGTEPDDVENATNRSPYPMLHLLREDSITAVENYPGGLEAIPARNIEMLRKLGRAGLAKIMDGSKKSHMSGD